ncbi:MAG: DUF5411 family protein [Bacilli bacterium]
MKWSFASVGLIVFGLIGVTIIMLFEELTTTNENDYYLLKEVTEAAMIDSVDISYYRETGELKIVREKFVENFTRRFAESTLLTGSGYTISFFDIIETPPKVSVTINTGIGEYTIYEDTSSYNVNNRLDAILEYIGENTYESSNSIRDPYTEKTYKKTYYNLVRVKDNRATVTEPVNIPEKLNQGHIKNVKIRSILGATVVEEEKDLMLGMLQREIDWAKSTEDDNRTDFNPASASTSIKNYASEIEVNISSPEWYNCSDNYKSKEWMKGTEVDCGKYDYFIHWTGDLNSSKSFIAVKYEVTWSYEEYEYK